MCSIPSVSSQDNTVFNLKFELENKGCPIELDQSMFYIEWSHEKARWD
jgi:hypothetical protein